MQLFYLFKGLELSPEAVRRIVDAVPSKAYDVRLNPDRFTFREAAAHIADWENVHFERVNIALTNPGGAAPDLNESQRALDPDYASQEPNASAAAFAESRARLMVVLSALREEDWSKTFVHSVRGPITLLEYAVLVLGHDMYHVEHLTQSLP